MSNEAASEGASAEEQVKQLYAYVAEQMKAGKDRHTIAREMEEQGVKRSDAEQLVGTIYREIESAVQQEQLTVGALVPATVAGLVAAAIGGAIWAGIVILTDYEVGFVAWGIGGLCGFAVPALAGGARGVPLQVIAVLTSVLGIAAGKYVTFHHFLKAYVEEEFGAEAVAELSLFSQGTFQMFSENASSMLSGYDILWVLLAVGTAWGIPKSSGIKLGGPGAQ